MLEWLRLEIGAGFAVETLEQIRIGWGGGSAVPWSQPCGRDDCRVRDTLPHANRRL